MLTCRYCGKPATHRGEGEVVCTQHIHPAAKDEYKRMPRYKVTGVLVNGRRFKAIHTDSYQYARGINLYRGTVWELVDGKWRVLWRVWN